MKEYVLEAFTIVVTSSINAPSLPYKIQTMLVLSLPIQSFLAASSVAMPYYNHPQEPHLRTRSIVN